MTSEYDELLLDLDIPQGSVWDVVSKEAAAAIRALTAQVVERDAVIEGVGTWRDRYFVGRDDWNKEIYDLLDQAPRDALAARDAVRDKTVRATALREAADDFAEREGVEALMFANDNIEAVRDTETWLRARADQEEGKSDG